MRRHLVFMAILLIVLGTSPVTGPVGGFGRSGRSSGFNHLVHAHHQWRRRLSAAQFVFKRTLWREIIDHILVGEYADAHTKALTKNYQVVLFTDTGTENQVVHVLLERTVRFDLPLLGYLHLLHGSAAAASGDPEPSPEIRFQYGLSERPGLSVHRVPRLISSPARIVVTVSPIRPATAPPRLQLGGRILSVLGPGPRGVFHLPGHHRCRPGP